MDGDGHRNWPFCQGSLHFISFFTFQVFSVLNFLRRKTQKTGWCYNAKNSNVKNNNIENNKKPINQLDPDT